MRALFSVSDKTGLVEFAKGLVESGWEIIATGGTQKLLEDSGVKTTGISDVTGFPEICGGRVKTLHPRVHGGLLGRRDNPGDMAQLKENGIETIDMVCVNLYPFEATVAKPGCTLEDAVEHIDIGGPSMLRSAAKNFAAVTVVCDPGDYDVVLDEIRRFGNTDIDTRIKLSAKAYTHTAQYDAHIATYMRMKAGLNEKLFLDFDLVQSLRYGENPHQAGAFFGRFDDLFEQLHGKEISYNNLLDIDAAVSLIHEFTDTTFAILKHNNACGLATRPTILEAWKDALAADPVSAFGGVLVANREIDAPTAEEINKIFFEVVIAPAYTEDALAILKQKKNRIILLQKAPLATKLQFRSVLNGALAQERDLKIETPEDLTPVTTVKPTDKQIADMLFANKIVKHSKSNAIVLAKDGQLYASGVGQTSRVDALKQAIEKAKSFNFDLNGAAMASDAFFPFADCVEIAHKAGIDAVIQPGGSIRDNESVDYCNANGVAMVTTGFRHFKH